MKKTLADIDHTTTAILWR